MLLDLFELSFSVPVEPCMQQLRLFACILRHHFRIRIRIRRHLIAARRYRRQTNSRTTRISEVKSGCHHGAHVGSQDGLHW